MPALKRTSPKKADVIAEDVKPSRDGTRDRILRTAERLFAERGFSNVSVRELAGEAKVNIALIGYHFTSKEGLLSEVYRRHCQPMIEERLAGPRGSVTPARPGACAAIIEAFVRPALEQIEAEDGATFIRLRAVLSGENSELLEKLVAKNFDESSTAFIDALCECLAEPVADGNLLAISFPPRRDLLHRGRPASYLCLFQRRL